MNDEGWITIGDARKLAHDSYTQGASDTIDTLVTGLTTVGRSDIAQVIRTAGDEIVKRLRGGLDASSNQ